MNLMERKNFGALREAVHTANPAMILGELNAAFNYGQGIEVTRYINDASRVAPYDSISTWGSDLAVAEMCNYIGKVLLTQKPEDLANLAYLIMSSQWCDEWLAFAIGVLGHIDVGTVNLGDALHWWCGHWRVLHQRILDAGYSIKTGELWALIAETLEEIQARNFTAAPQLAMTCGYMQVIVSVYEDPEWDWSTYDYERWESHRGLTGAWYVGLKPPSLKNLESPLTSFNWVGERVRPAQQIRGHK